MTKHEGWRGVGTGPPQRWQGGSRAGAGRPGGDQTRQVQGRPSDARGSRDIQATPSCACAGPGPWVSAAGPQGGHFVPLDPASSSGLIMRTTTCKTSVSVTTVPTDAVLMGPRAPDARNSVYVPVRETAASPKRPKSCPHCRPVRSLFPPENGISSPYAVFLT